MDRSRPRGRRKTLRWAGALALSACAADWGWSGAAPEPPARLEPQASGVFLNRAGDVLTARHAVTACRALYVVKHGRVAPASVRAADEALDVAVLSTGLAPYLGATFPRRAQAAGSRSVFTEAYGVLRRLPDRASLRANALTVPGQGGLLLLSAARPGASGSGVLGDDGLLLGMVVERVAMGSRGTTRPLSAAAGPRPGGPSRVRAVPADAIKAFLRRRGIAFAESDRAQLGPRQSPAARAWTLSVGIICGERYERDEG